MKTEEIRQEIEDVLFTNLEIEPDEDEMGRVGWTYSYDSVSKTLDYLFDRFELKERGDE